MNYYNNGSFFALLLVVSQVSTNSPFFVASDEREAVVSLDGRTVITDSLSEEDDSEEDFFCFEHDDCKPRDSFFCVPGLGVCQEKLGEDEFCENSEWCKEHPLPLKCLDRECVQISTTLKGGAFCSKHGDCDSGFFCNPKRNFCIRKKGDGMFCQDNNWCINNCKGNKCGERSGDDVGPADVGPADVGPAYGSGDDARILGTRNILGPRNGLNKKCNNHKDCGKIGYCCNPGTMGKIGSFKSCEPRRKEGESCDGNDKWPNRICKNGLKCKKCNGLKCICCNPKEESCV